nr:hypothetical protein [Tanacetum cinerariifolium]
MVNTRNASLFPLITLESLQEQLQQLQQTILIVLTNQSVVNTEIQALNKEEENSNGRGSHTHNTQYGRMSKIEFPKFHGEDVKRWVYISLVWHQQYVKKYEDITPWEMYEGEVVKRFGAIYKDSIVDLKNLKQEGSVQQYQEIFESLLNRVELNEAYAVRLFIRELKKEVSMPIGMFMITNLIDVYVMAKMQEATNAVLKPRYNSAMLPTPKFVSNSVNKPVNASFKLTNVNGVNQSVSRTGGNRSYRLTRKELEEKRAKNQRFYCDQKYFPGHKCNGQLYSLEVVSENDIELITEGEGETMKVKGMLGKHTLQILIDCGSTHNFLDLKTAKNLGCKFKSTITLQVYVANGQNMISCYECKNFQWSLQGETFTNDVMLLPLGGCEMVLGIHCKNSEEHYKHLAMVLQIMQDNTLFAKKSKCSFDVSQADYLGHIISTQGVSIDPTKIEAIQKWSIPTTIKPCAGKSSSHLLFSCNVACLLLLKVAR